MTCNSNGAGGSGGGSESLSRDFRGRAHPPPRKFLDSKYLSCKALEHLSFLEIDLNGTKIITVQDYKSTKHYCGWKCRYRVLKLRLKRVTYESKI